MADKVKTGERRPNEVDVYVGSRLRQRRRLLSVSQEKLADALGLTFQQVQKYERGFNRISASKLFEAARRVNREMDHLCGQMITLKHSTTLSEKDPLICRIFLFILQDIPIEKAVPKLYIN